MIDLNLGLDYKKEPYLKGSSRHKIFVLDDKGLEEYCSKDHITHKFLSKFNPKIMEYVRIMSIDKNEESSSLNKPNILKNLDFKNKKSDHNSSKAQLPQLNETQNFPIKKHYINSNNDKNRNSMFSLRIKHSEKDFEKTHFLTLNNFYNSSNSNHFNKTMVKDFDKRLIQDACSSENDRLLKIFKKYKVPVRDRKYYKLEVNVNNL